MFHRTQRYWITLWGLVFILAACEDEPNACPPTGERGRIIAVTVLGELTSQDLNQLLADSQLENAIEAQYDLDLFKLIYQTVAPAGSLTVASGALFVPRLEPEDGFPLLSVHHGTETGRQDVASVNVFNSPEGLLLAASSGFLTCVPDYLGLGESTLIHPYIHAPGSAAAVIDCIRAARNYSCQEEIPLNGQLFLAGYSEGGYVTLAAHRAMEKDLEDEFQITASAPMAGPYDVLGTAYEYIGAETYPHPAYFGYLGLAYNSIYGWDRLEEIFASPFATLLPALYDGSLTTSQINRQLPRTVGDLLQSTFIEAFLGDGETELKAALKANSLLNWAPRAPVRFYHGDSDETVPYFNALRALDSLTARGGTSVELVTISSGTHQSAALEAIEGSKKWFDSFLN